MGNGVGDDAVREAAGGGVTSALARGGVEGRRRAVGGRNRKTGVDCPCVLGWLLERWHGDAYLRLPGVPLAQPCYDLGLNLEAEEDYSDRRKRSGERLDCEFDSISGRIRELNLPSLPPSSQPGQAREFQSLFFFFSFSFRNREPRFSRDALNGHFGLW